RCIERALLPPLFQIEHVCVGALEPRRSAGVAMQRGEQRLGGIQGDEPRAMFYQVQAEATRARPDLQQRVLLRQRERVTQVVRDVARVDAVGTKSEVRMQLRIAVEMILDRL